HVIWQERNHWPLLEFMHNATSRKMAPISTTSFLLRQMIQMNPGTVWLWVLGLLWGLRPAERARGRVLATAFLIALAIVLSTGKSRTSYLAVAYPMLLALGGVAAEQLAAPRRWLRPIMVLPILALGALALPFAIPILPVAAFVRFERALGREPQTDERQSMGSLPQQYADMFGWPEMTALVAKAYARLTPEERRHCRVFGQNYGEAGAIDVLGRKLGLPRAISGHNSYWLWGPGDFDGSVLIIIGGDREDNAKFFEQIEIVGQTSSPWSMPYERGLDVSIARRPRVGLRTAWPQLKNYI
ncbi:MAG: glycosyltransferase family 39 protein, partial [Candidatus Eiseniibacteriota bacterium]